MDFGSNLPDSEDKSEREIAESFAYMLKMYMKMADRLYSGSNIDLINGTHGGLPEALLQEILIRKQDDKTIIGFEKLKEIGGGLKPAEGMDFLIKIDEKNEKTIKLHFRNEEYDLDLDKLNELARSYAEGKKER